MSEYTRKMMGFLAFQPRPERALVVGLGGGSLVKYCYRYLPATHVTAIEIDADVLALRSEFFIPSDGERLKIIQADGADHVSQVAAQGERTDAMLVDAFDHTGIAGAVVKRSFVENAKRILGAHGVFVMNLVGAIADCKHHVATIRLVFGESVIVIPTQRGSSWLVFASQSLLDPQRLTMAVRNAERAQGRLGLFFPTLIQHLTELANKWVFGDHYVLK